MEVLPLLFGRNLGRLVYTRFEIVPGSCVSHELVTITVVGVGISVHGVSYRKDTKPSVGL